MFKLTCAVILLASASGVAIAGPADTVTEAVTYADLDLSRAEGRNTLEARLRQAVRRVCPPEHRSTLREAGMDRRCEIEARAQARREMEVAVAEAASREGRQRVASR